MLNSLISISLYLCLSAIQSCLIKLYFKILLYFKKVHDRFMYFIDLLKDFKKCYVLKRVIVLCTVLITIICAAVKNPRFLKNL